jgi:hypothetical protein
VYWLCSYSRYVFYNGSEWSTEELHPEKRQLQLQITQSRNHNRAGSYHWQYKWKQQGDQIVSLKWSE